jgi:hypothetical protein
MKLLLIINFLALSISSVEPPTPTPVNSLPNGFNQSSNPNQPMILMPEIVRSKNSINRQDERLKKVINTIYEYNAYHDDEKLRYDMPPTPEKLNSSLDKHHIENKTNSDAKSINRNSSLISLASKKKVKLIKV